MIIIKLYILLLSLLFNIYPIYGQILSKEQVLKIEIGYCNERADCPSDSKGCIYNHCYFKYYCRNNECVSSTNSTYFYNKDKKEGLIVDVCTQNAIHKQKCSTPTCHSDADCFSNHCVNNICIADDTMPVIKCGNTYEKGIPLMKCKNTSFEKCNSDNDCFSGYCTKEKFCNNQENNTKKRRNVAIFLIGAVFGFVCLILIIIILYNLVIYIKRKQNNYEDDEEEEIEEINEEEEEEDMSYLTEKHKKENNAISEEDLNTNNKKEISVTTQEPISSSPNMHSNSVPLEEPLPSSPIINQISVPIEKNNSTIETNEKQITLPHEGDISIQIKEGDITQQ